MRIGIVFGGNGPERGISLNSARSLCDHLGASDHEITLLYLDPTLQPYELQRSHLYSNTPSDFDFKLHSIASALSSEGYQAVLRSLDIVFPAIHGSYGEDGQLQAFLEQLGVPFVGASSRSCALCFDKYLANEFIREHGFYAPPSLSIERAQLQAPSKLLQSIEEFMSLSQSERFVVKPATGGSSIGVHTACTSHEVLTLSQRILSDGLYMRVVVEEFCNGKEFTVVLLQSAAGEVVSLMPIGIETDYSGYQIFDFRKKYLPTRQVSYHCPPRFPEEVTERIMSQAESLFGLFHMKDFSRFDGWLMPDGEIWFSDFNPISGMEQNSFLFIAGARAGMSHQDVAAFIVASSAERQGIKHIPRPRQASADKLPVRVIFGGNTAERQVSVMSGTNVWLKLRSSVLYEPEPYFLDSQGQVWRIPYAFALHHTAEEIEDACTSALLESKDREGVAGREVALRKNIRERLGAVEYFSLTDFSVSNMTLEECVSSSPFLFLGLHGGIGEDGTIQRLCESGGVPFNGSPSAVCMLSVNKYDFGRRVEALEIAGVSSLQKYKLRTVELQSSSFVATDLWEKVRSEVGDAPYVIKPNSDGCSAGVCRLDTATDLEHYLKLLLAGVERIPRGELHAQETIIEMPSELPSELIIERFIITDSVKVNGTTLEWEEKTGWVEITAGVVETQTGLQCLLPSITVASEAILSVEEKFQGGTGVNITPPPPPFVSEEVVERVRQFFVALAEGVGLRGYGRFDAFMNHRSGELIVIELNNLPALTPSTVLFQQALATTPSRSPRELVELLIESGLRYANDLKASPLRRSE